MIKKSKINYKGIITLFVLLIAFISLFFVNIQIKVSADSAYPAYDDLVETHETISVNSCDFVLDVHEDGNITFEQTFEVTFLQSRLTEVIFMVPYQGTLFREYNGKIQEISYFAKISNYRLELGQEGTEELRIYQDEETGFITFGIKKPDGYYTRRDSRSYTLYYDYNMWNEGVEEYDEVYINLLSGMSSMPIKNVTFEINLPKPVDFDTYIPYIYTGDLGSSDNLVDVLLSEDNKTIKSVTSFDVSSGGGLTYKQFLPKGYLNIEKPSSFILIISSLIAIALAIIVIYLKVNKKLKQKIVTPVEVVVPENMDPVFAEYLYKNKLSNKVFPAIIVYLANLKYIKIVEDKELGVVRLINLKQIDWKNLKEESLELPKDIRRFYKDIFKCAKVNSEGCEEIILENISGKDLYYNFERMKDEQKRIFDKDGYVKESKTIKSTKIICNILSIVAFVLGTVGQMWFMLGLIPNIVWGYLMTIGIASLFALIGKFMSSGGNNINFLMAIIFCVFGIFAPIIICIGTFQAIPNWYLILISEIVVVISIVMHTYKEYTLDFARKKGQLLGLKKYIQYAEKDRIEKLVHNNPEIFFDILPYAYILDVSDKWIEMFEMQFGDDTSYYNTFVCIRISTFNRSFRTVNTSFMQERASQIRSRMSSSSGGGGGGFSGGGSSGGGGGGGSFGGR